jgi:hypothetical protein
MKIHVRRQAREMVAEIPWVILVDVVHKLSLRCGVGAGLLRCCIDCGVDCSRTSVGSIFKENTLLNMPSSPVSASLSDGGKNFGCASLGVSVELCCVLDTLLGALSKKPGGTPIACLGCDKD